MESCLPKDTKMHSHQKVAFSVGENMICEGVECAVGWGYDETKGRIKGCKDAALCTVGEEVV
jgi:hypothetical protein